jgi:hypothetical protein
MAMLEMASRNMSSGRYNFIWKIQVSVCDLFLSVRMFFSFIRSLKLGFGLSLASRFFKFLTGITTPLRCAPAPLMPLYGYALIIPFSAAVCIHHKAHWHQWPMVNISRLLIYQCAVNQVNLSYLAPYRV